MEWEGWDGDAFEECNIECRRSSDTRENSSLAKNRSDRKLLANGISKDRDFLFVKKNRPPLRKWKTEDTPFLSFRIERNKGFLSKSLGELFARRARPRREGRAR